MRGEFIAFDLETTGLDPASDEIIEIGIARFRDGQLVEQYQSLVNPSKPIPPEITQLTGIDQEDVDDQPRLQDILGDVARIIGDLPLVAHNAQFDVTFLGKHHPLDANLAIDTVELASIMLPSAPRYSLGSLTSAMGIELERAHRAFDDALATGQLYWNLWEMLCQLPTGLLAEIIEASSGKSWRLRAVFQAALSEALKATGPSSGRNPFLAERLTAPALDIGQAGHQPLAPSAIDQVFSEGGKLARYHDAYEARPQQLEMAQAITRALNQGEQLMIEAGTGTGKSIAYLVPAALWARSNGQRVTVSTYTINLQEQLLKQDIPLVEKIVGGSLQAALMKGRANYLCPRRLATMRRRKPANLDELRTLAKILVWLENSSSGDRGEINLFAGERSVWPRLSAQDEDCTAFRCASEMGAVCPYYKARKKAETAHILITNHALLIADARIDNRALPDFHHLIVDEAHQLEDAITDGLSRRIDQPLILARLRNLGSNKSGAFGAFLAAAREHFPPEESDRLATFIANISAAVDEMKREIRRYFRALHDFAKGSDASGRYARRLLNSHRETGSFVIVQTTWNHLAEYLLAVTDSLEHLCKALPRYERFQLPDFNGISSEIRANWRFLAEIHEQLEQFTNDPASNAIYAITANDSPGRLQIHISPSHVGPMMDEYLNQRMESIVLTSATLTTQSNFDHISERLYTEEYQKVALGSPFDYKTSTLLFVPTDMPEPSRREYQRMVERGIIELAAELGGRVMVLFTSYSQLRKTAQAVSPRLALGDITVYDQSFGGSRDALLKSFKAADKAVLLGTRSFWEGVDIPGDDLSALVIARLPFAVPSDPVFSARSETYSDPFQQFAVPDAILRFRQGFGRLIRRRSDRGLVAIFDSRVLSKRYGRDFLESLPECAVQFSSLENLPNIAAAWIDESRNGK